jgi:hypothetical protein
MAPILSQVLNILWREVYERVEELKSVSVFRILEKPIGRRGWGVSFIVPHTNVIIGVSDS